MPMFDAMNIADSGLTTHRKWLDAVADNIANINNVSRMDQPAFQERFIIAESATPKREVKPVPSGSVFSPFARRGRLKVEATSLAQVSSSSTPRNPAWSLCAWVRNTNVT